MVKKYWADAIKDLPESSKLAAEIYGDYILLVSETIPVLEKVCDLLISLEDRAHGAAGEEMTELRRDVEKLLNKLEE